MLQYAIIECFAQILTSPQLHEPYSDNEHTHGVMRITPELLNNVVPKFFVDGWQVVCFSRRLRCSLG
jgi:hypothetical protein